MPADRPTIELAADGLLDRPTTGRVVTRTRPVRLGDVDTTGRLRLDATARFLQDVATDDADDARLDEAYGWVVRRTLVEVRREAVIGEHLELATFCSGTGRSWAERRTSITGDRGASIETAGLWIRVDTASGRPTALGDEFTDVYAASAGGRRVSTRLQLPLPPAHAQRRSWLVRRVDLDPLGHVNNAVHWAVVEETLPVGWRRGRGEVEHLAPLDPDVPVDLLTAISDKGDVSSWLVAGEAVVTAARWTPAP